MLTDNAGGSPASHIHAPRIITAYRFGTISITVDLDDYDVARWLTEFLSPWFSIAMPDSSGLRVSMTNSWERFSALSRRETEINPQPIPCFGLDSTLVSCPGWIESDGTILAADKEFGCYYQLQGSHIEVICRPMDRPARIGLMRVVRELAIPRTSPQAETLDLHAAAFVFRGRAILLAGDKKAGKTTLLAYALSSGHTALLANDRVVVDVGRLQAHGVPTVVSIRNETEQVFSSLGRLKSRRAVLLHGGEVPSGKYTGTGVENRLVLSLAQFARQLNASVQPFAPIETILFPEISPLVDTYSLEPLDPSDAAIRLRNSVYGNRSYPRPETVFQKLTKAFIDTTVQDFLVNRLTTAFPAMRCLLGKNAYCERSHDWLKTLPIKNGMAQL